jgi:hypothetical protein
MSTFRNAIQNSSLFQKSTFIKKRPSTYKPKKWRNILDYLFSFLRCVSSHCRLSLSLATIFGMYMCLQARQR